ncbi:hypothetical protein [Acetivibrio cellulolyticus]|uniref:hypothetical protein n=1 Tax=Acetivibrio cellulolyticus TaxID=35830 RepID=UPI0001E2C77E|nr:hypothetical protein [Acetivibrio cellulolyticus]
MLKTELICAIRDNVKVGMVFDNPGRGSSEIVSVSNERIVYKRGNSKLYLKIQDFIDVYEKFAGKRCTTNDIKAFNPRVFCSRDNGHGCHCTFIFTILDYLKLLKNGICGSGKVGDSFYIEILP